MKPAKVIFLVLLLLNPFAISGSINWNSYPSVEGNFFRRDTGAFLGEVFTLASPYIWSESLQRYLYFPVGSQVDHGAWAQVIFHDHDSLRVARRIRISVEGRERVSNDGLFFSGPVQFGRTITARSGSLAVYENFIFVAWYRGGMDDRHVMLSRRHVNDTEWQTIQFPHQHIGFRGDPTIGDSHNTIVIGISPIDGTVHMLYDMHAYRRDDFPDSYFNYNISLPGAATAENWDISLFNERQSYLRPGEDYQLVTYPSFRTNSDGDLLASWRIGGHTSGSLWMARYDGVEWSPNWRVTFGQGGNRWGPYGSIRYAQDAFHLVFHARYPNNPAAELQSGLYYAMTPDPGADRDWQTIDGTPLTLPISIIAPLRLAEPVDLGLGNRIATSPDFVITDDGSMHFVTTVSGTDVHYFRGPDETELNVAVSGVPSGSLFTKGNVVFLRELRDGRIHIWATPAGKNEWELVFFDRAARDNYSHGAWAMQDGILYFFGQHLGNAERLPIDLIRFRLEMDD